MSKVTLTSQQKDELIELYVERIVDSMDEKELVRYVSQDMTDFLEKLTDSELNEEISLTMDDEVLEELVDNVGGKYEE